MKLNYYINKLIAIVNSDYDHEIPDVPRGKAFTKTYSSMIKKICAENGWTCIPHEGYCEATGFITDGNHYVYYNSGDCRWSVSRFQYEWKDHILIRTAQNNHDYHGGSNHYTNLTDFANKARELLSFSHSV